MKRIWILCIIAVIALAGCGGGKNGGNTGSEQEQVLTFGPLTSRIAGTINPPVSAAGEYAAVTAVSGGLVSSLSLADMMPGLRNSQIAFTSNRSGNVNIHTMNTDGTSPTQLTAHGMVDYYPAWSPDAAKIAFTTNRHSSVDEIYTMNADGTGEVRLTNNTTTDYYPAWSPNGSKIAFVGYRDGNAEIYTMNTDGSSPTRLTNNSAYESEPSWSPDGAKIAFVSNRDGNFEIYIMNSNGSSQTRLTNNTSSEYGPAWSPDGGKIAFYSYRDGNAEIYVMDADGTDQTRLTHDAAVDYLPCWSPDGAKIAFVSNRDGNYEIYRMSSSGASETRATNNIAADSKPAWSPYVGKRSFIGTGGILGTAAAGFLFARCGGSSASIVTFDTPTDKRTTAKVTAQTFVNSPTMILTVEADSLTSLKFVNGAVPKGTVVIGSGGVATTATGAIVDICNTNSDMAGLVTSVLPYTASRTADRPTVGMEGGVQVMKGRFLGVWDGTGKNHAPGGASEVRLEAKTGVVLSVR
ncbi:MAG: PD40 domain-containing protein [Armatimonadetes bacterium]|nr:PD40 domain-containing protein [Armatimonadota bacterium]